MHCTETYRNMKDAKVLKELWIYLWGSYKDKSYVRKIFKSSKLFDKYVINGQTLHGPYSLFHFSQAQTLEWTQQLGVLGPQMRTSFFLGPRAPLKGLFYWEG